MRISRIASLVLLAGSAAPLAAQTPTQSGGTALDAASRAAIIEGAIAQLEQSYVFPEVAAKMAAAVRDRQKRGEYDAVTSGAEFAMRLSTDFQAVSKDKHLRVGYSARGFPATVGEPGPEQREQMRQQLVASNCGFEKWEKRDGNIGYVKFNMFAPVDACADKASEVMSSLAGVRALVIDLRSNGGGHPAMVAHISSYLFSKRTHLNDIWERRSNETESFYTNPAVPGAKIGDDVPVYVLTSKYTFSGAEEFSYNLKNLKRATIVGETTGGGAHPVRGQRISENFVIGVPFARAINPITKTNWEGTGVAPDVPVPANDALDTALRLIGQRAVP